MSRRSNPLWLRLLAVALLAGAALLWASQVKQGKERAAVQRHIDAGARFAQERKGMAAEREWREAARLDPKNPQIWELLGELYLSTENPNSAADAYETLVALAPQTPGAHSRLATALYGLGIESGAFQHAEAALKLDPDDVAALGILAFLYGHSGNEARQIECLARLNRLLPEDVEFTSLYAQLLTVRARYDEALPQIERLEKLTPSSHLPHSLRGVMALNQDPSPAGLAKAVALFEKAIALEPRAPFPQLYLGKTYLRLKQPEKARTVLEALAQKIPAKMDLQYELARTYTLLGDTARATAARTAFEKLRADVDRASALRKRASADPNDLAAHREFGLMNLKAGDFRNARLYLTRAATLKPDDAEVKAALAEARRGMGETLP